ncbi:uncharacterized protein RCC_01809 [Ramularia collo-cygni]|uniref:Decapping nuclease n=1 Tax=Ramularia collo-cygni TaxID=112498 RepID=A0A2D3V388_9PEZI|nr:uncharacterized protein RCC_01809 [Ramularia collo-cygni]CZT15969.1 uncharacterized protein RCC_01809 [Ramularia collo-cygni]
MNTIRGRGQGGGAMRDYRSAIGVKTSASPAPPFGALLQTIMIQELGSQTDPKYEHSKISGCKYMASFNWLKSEMPTIVMPGMPPKWTPLKEPEELKEDSGEYYRDVNAAHYSDHPIEPAVRALLAQNDSFPVEGVDLFACGSTMGNLLGFVRDDHRDFRFVVESIGETTLFIRRPNSPTEKIPDVRGYGHAFPEKYTTYDKEVQGSDSHQRLIMYDFAGFQCIVRSEVDGYFADESGKQELPSGILNLPDLERLRMKNGGIRIPQEAVFDIKTRSARRPGDYLAKEMGRLWVRQIPHFVLAYHERGTFKDIKVQDIRREMAAWEKDHGREIDKLAVLIAKITSRARSKPDERFEVCCQAPGILEMRHVGGVFEPALPDDLHKVWTAHLSDSDASQDAGSGAEGSEDFESGDEDDDVDKDYTLCSGECEYCGRCKK